MSLKTIKLDKKDETTYFKLNNELNIPVDGVIPLDKDKESVRAYFLEYVNPNTVFFHNLKEKINYLTKNNFIEKEFISMYDFEFIKELFKHVYSKKFRFKSFMGAHKFYTQYALKNLDKTRILERYEDRISFTALYLANGDEELAMNLAEEMIEQRYQPATPTFANAGKVARGEFISCFLIDIQDNMESIGRAINSSLQLSKKSGGVGINLSNLREAGASIKGIKNASSGVVPVMKIFEDSFSYANQLGQRQGAGAVYLNIFHPDIIDFLATKKENADEKVRVKTLSLGVTVPNKYYELIKNDEYMYLFSPYDVERIYKKPFSYVDITAEYDNMVNNPDITKTKIKARDLENEISKLQQESGYPYILNIDTANKENPVNGNIIMSNLCSEILQVQSPSKLNRDLSYDVIGNDISCNLGSTNIANMIDSPDFGKSVEVAIRALNSVSDKSNIEEVPTIQQANENYHSVGLGAMSLHTALALNQIHYESDEAIEFTDAYFRAFRFYALKASNKIAKETGIKFFEFDKSEYADGSYLYRKYIECGDVSYKSEKVNNLFQHIIPTVQDWKELSDNIIEHGLYNSYTLAIAPTGSISYINEASASLHPITQLIEERQEKKTGKTYYPAPHLSNDTIDYYKKAYDMDMRRVIDVYSTAQYHIDQGMSLTLFMRSEIPEGTYEWKNGRTNKMTSRDLNILRNYAWEKGIKSLYYVRTFTDDEELTSSNMCESCSI